MSIPLELVDQFDGTLDVAATQRNFDEIAQLVPGFGGKSVEIRAGTSTVTFTNAVIASAVTNVSHGLGRLPIAVLLSPSNAGSAWTPEHGALNSISVVEVQGYGNGALVGAVRFSWIAIG